MKIEFRNDYVTVLKRIEFRSTADFLSGSGGLFGLFIGASFLSLVEFIYFFIIRIFCHRRNQTEEETVQNIDIAWIRGKMAKQSSDKTDSRNRTSVGCSKN